MPSRGRGFLSVQGRAWNTKSSVRGRAGLAGRARWAASSAFERVGDTLGPPFKAVVTLRVGRRRLRGRARVTGTTAAGPASVIQFQLSPASSFLEQRRVCGGIHLWLPLRRLEHRGPTVTDSNGSMQRRRKPGGSAATEPRQSH
jgi:hypothetical protein